MADCWQPQASVVVPHWTFQENQPCFCTSTFRDLMSAFPRPKHTSRVTKPRSAGNSPSAAAKRRTTMSHHPSMYSQPPQQQGYQPPMDVAAMASAMRRARKPRPMSWHPASLGMATYPTAQYIPAATTADNLAATGLCAAPDTIPVTFGGDGMLPPYSIPDTAMSDTMLSYFSGVGDAATAMQASYLQQQQQPMDDSQVAWDAGTSQFSTMITPMSDGWSFDMMSMNNSMPSADVAGSSYESAPSSTGPSTPDFLPIQQFDNDANFQSEPLEKEDELVGMGLYSHPEMSLNSSLNGLGGKGLKLEETFTPSADEGIENKDADAEDDDDEQESNEDPLKNDSSDRYPAQPDPQPYHQQPVKSTQSMLNRSFFFDDDDKLDHNGGITQQFFNLENQPCLNYAYGWI
ncbi:uncharacterized protein ACLA_015830 [Aspergillus clavatus NRRL 1]|uniref:Uncharacterized protein n=1 Tax=Aspergillus clavatus (strain ATCC 1007 / CBS 513.65 / DSM 816 / NCTC 3887 / NRRL 1 / QM 1276 / 107) TaxID=344612 RepID=A1CBM0_ASPCL|nr:uncharacterized protein ACLA_015830 [Aspergillus clavatus NRRL 1]EAW13138.1 conserved hypothetical protein [Aspergillus clavatus NRRL 1]